MNVTNITQKLIKYYAPVLYYFEMWSISKQIFPDKFLKVKTKGRKTFLA